MSQETAVLQSDGKFTIGKPLKSVQSNPDTDNVIQISDDDEHSDKLKCKICKLISS